MRQRPALLIGLPLALLPLFGCTQFPALDATITPALEQADYPALVPLEPLLAEAQAPGIDEAQTRAGMENDIAALRARSAALRGPLLSPAERARLTAGRR
ncbi:hypothetical protein ACFSUD_02660 [Sulfitobacter aestuarii]|uniref:DUF3035 domain-containing protein n=1 Tax=Sulfitobacter aestuarii TaxID=2161676 RepID=A0ABW5TYB8_9RHOB